MNYLRLNNTKEFFKDGLEIGYLGGIDNINIIIGANNSRKSRFLRTIIAQDSKLIIRGQSSLNELISDSKTLFDDVKKNDKDLTDKLIQFQFTLAQTTTRRYTNIKDQLSPRTDLDFFSIKTIIDNINNTMLSSNSPTELEKLKAIITNLLELVEFVNSIYNLLSNNGIPQRTFSSWVETTDPHILYAIEHVGGQIKDFEIRRETFKNILKYLSGLRGLSYEFGSKSMIYIPVLRTSRMLGNSSDDIFAETIIKQHFPNPNNKLIIETGLTLYEKIGLARNGSRKQSRDFMAFEKFIGEAFFQSDDLHIVAHQSKKSEEQIIKVSLPGELEDVPIQDLGDGIQAVINLLFPIFTADDGSWIFIDEPENHLHPGYQNIFMRAVSQNESIKKKKLIFFINTHSNHILSSALLESTETEILVFSRKDMNSSSIQAFNGNEFNTLKMLGIFNTSVLISNCSIWIEGVTDRFYLQSFLYAYYESLESKAFKPAEGMNFAFIEYGGKNLVHFDFDHSYDANAKTKAMDNDVVFKDKVEAYFINSNVFLLADSDFDEERHVIYEKIERENFKYCQTKLPEIENIIPDKILHGYLIHIKCKEEEILKCFPIPEKIKLGAHLQSKITLNGKPRKFEAKSGGTLADRYKKTLARYVHESIISKTYTWDDLKKSKVLNEIVTSMYNFIKEKNGK